MKTVEIVPVLQDGKLVYPATITPAIVDPKSKVTLDKYIDKMRDYSDAIDKVKDLGVMDASTVDTLFDEVFGPDNVSENQ